MATHSSILAWRIPGTEEPGGLHSMDKESDTTEWHTHTFANKGLYNWSCRFFSSYVQMWELDHEEVWVPKNWCFQTVLMEKTLKSPLNCKEIKPVNPKGNQLLIRIGRTDSEAETPVFWPPDVKSRLWCWERLRAGGEGDSRRWDG